jgi:hypothetical protein
MSLKKKITLTFLFLFVITLGYYVDKFAPYALSPFKISQLQLYQPLDVLQVSDTESGKLELKQHKVLILGISRDNRRSLQRVIKYIEFTAEQFKDYKVIIFENDSTDGTKIMLKFWSWLNNKVEIITQDFNLRKRPSIKFLADIRNKYLDNIEGKYTDYDMIMILDMDMQKGWDIRGVYDTFSKITRWQAICANGLDTEAGNKMADAFAFRNDEFPYGPEVKDYWTKIIPKVQKIYQVNTPLILVKSCFNGLAFYKRKFIEGCRYDSINEDCEHIAFNECIKDKNGGKMYFNPSMVIRY